MDRDVVWDMINHFDNKTIILSGNNAGPWKLSIYCDYAFGVAQSCHILHLNLQK